MSELVLSRAYLRDSSAAEREAKLLVYLTNAHNTAVALRSAAERYDVVRDLEALKAMAKAFVISSAASRKLGETSLLCLRLFGEALRTSHPGESNPNNQLRAQATGASPTVCQNASVLAGYDEKVLIEAFEIVRVRNEPAAFKPVYAAMREKHGRRNRQKIQPSAILESQMKGSLIRALRMALSIGLRIMEAKSYTLADAQREYGISQRSFERSIERLRAAGMILDRRNGAVHFVAIDTTLSEGRVA